jgi:hypothetical protein
MPTCSIRQSGNHAAVLAHVMRIQPLRYLFDLGCRFVKNGCIGTELFPRFTQAPRGIITPSRLGIATTAKT